MQNRVFPFTLYLCIKDMGREDMDSMTAMDQEKKIERKSKTKEEEEDFQ